MPSPRRCCGDEGLCSAHSCARNGRRRFRERLTIERPLQRSVWKVHHAAKHITALPRATSSVGVAIDIPPTPCRNPRRRRRPRHCPAYAASKQRTPCSAATPSSFLQHPWRVEATTNQWRPSTHTASGDVANSSHGGSSRTWAANCVRGGSPRRGEMPDTATREVNSPGMHVVPNEDCRWDWIGLSTIPLP